MIWVFDQLTFRGVLRTLSNMYAETLCKNNKQLLAARHSVKCVRIRSFSGPYFPAFGLNTDRYEASLRIQSK